MKRSVWKILLVLEVFLLTERPLLAMGAPLTYDNLSQIEKYGYQFGKLASESFVVMTFLSCLYCIGKLTKGLIDMTIRGMKPKKLSYTDEDTPNNLNTENAENSEFLHNVPLPLLLHNNDFKQESVKQPNFSNQGEEQKLKDDNGINLDRLISGDNDSLRQAVGPSVNAETSLIDSQEKKTDNQIIERNSVKQLDSISLADHLQKISDDSSIDNLQNSESLAMEPERDPIDSQRTNSNQSQLQVNALAKEPVESESKEISLDDSKENSANGSVDNSQDFEFAEIDTKKNDFPYLSKWGTLTPPNSTTSGCSNVKLSSQIGLIGGDKQDDDCYYEEVKKLPSSSPFQSSKKETFPGQLSSYQQGNQHQQLPSFEMKFPMSPPVKGGFNFFKGIGGGSPVKRLPGLPG